VKRKTGSLLVAVDVGEPLAVVNVNVACSGIRVAEPGMEGPMSTHLRDTETACSGDCFDPGDRWVPVDRRWWGMDKRTLVPAMVVLALAFVQGVLLPRIDAAIPIDDVTVVGDVIALQGGITFPAVADWSLVDGERLGEERNAQAYPRDAVLARGGAQFSVQTGDFSGDVAALLAQIEKTNDALTGGHGLTAAGDPVAITARTGEPGLITRYASAELDGVLAAFVFDGIGVEVVAVGPAQTGQDLLTDVGQMIAGIGHTERQGA